MDKDCFTRFPNHLLDAIISGHFSAIQTACILYVVRKTYGWNKNSDSISVSKLAKDTGYTRRGTIIAVQQLEAMSVLSVERPGPGKISSMSVNSPDRWNKPVNGGSHVNGDSQGIAIHRGVNGGSQVGVNGHSQEPVNSGSHTKETKTPKYTITKESFSPAGNDMRAIENENDMSSANASTESDLILPDEVFEDDSLWT